jgi:hypothetical protein
MREITVKFDTPRFHVEIKRSGEGKVPPIWPPKLAQLPLNAYVLIGERTSEMGGGVAGTGYVMLNGKAVYSISVSEKDVRNGLIRFS